MKKFVIAVNNVVLFIAVFVIWLIGVGAILQGDMQSGLLVLVIGTLAWCVASGVWFVLAAIYDELVNINDGLGEIISKNKHP